MTGWRTLKDNHPDLGTPCQVRAADTSQFNASMERLHDGRSVWVAALGGMVLTLPEDEWRAVSAETEDDDG